MDTSRHTRGVKVSNGHCCTACTCTCVHVYVHVGPLCFAHVHELSMNNMDVFIMTSCAYYAHTLLLTFLVSCAGIHCC